MGRWLRRPATDGAAWEWRNMAGGSKRIRSSLAGEVPRSWKSFGGVMIKSWASSWTGTGSNPFIRTRLRSIFTSLDVRLWCAITFLPLLTLNVDDHRLLNQVPASVPWQQLSFWICKHQRRQKLFSIFPKKFRLSELGVANGQLEPFFPINNSISVQPTLVRTWFTYRSILQHFLQFKQVETTCPAQRVIKTNFTKTCKTLIPTTHTHSKVISDRSYWNEARAA